MITPEYKNGKYHIPCKECGRDKAYLTEKKCMRYLNTRCSQCAKEAIEWYEKREYNLWLLGFNSYSEYLKSDLWHSIRLSVLFMEEECAACGKPTNQVHHIDYDIDTLKGVCFDNLIALCRNCHRLIEFDDAGQKLPLPKVNERLFTMIDQYVYNILPAEDLISKDYRECLDGILGPIQEEYDETDCQNK